MSSARKQQPKPDAHAKRHVELCIELRGRLRCAEADLTEEEFEDLVMHTASMHFLGELGNEPRA